MAAHERLEHLLREEARIAGGVALRCDDRLEDDREARVRGGMAGVRRRFVDEVQTPRERSARVALSAHEQLVNGATASFWYRPFPVIDALAALLYLGTAYAFYAGVTDLLQHQHQHDENGDEGAGAARNSNFEFFFFLSPAASEDSAAVLEEAAASLSSAMAVASLLLPALDV